MPVDTKIVANERSTTLIPTAVRDWNGDPAEAVVSYSWTLSDQGGNLINDRKRQTVAGPASDQNILLTGEDLIVTESAGLVNRILLVEATYVKDGKSYPFKEEFWFQVRNLVMVPIDGTASRVRDSDVIGDDTILADETLMGE